MSYKLALVSVIAGLVLSTGLWAVSYLNITYRGTNTRTTLSYGRVNWHLHKWYKSRETQWEIEGLRTHRPFQTTWYLLYKWNDRLVLLVLPMWIPTLIFGTALCGCLALPAHRRHRRRKRGLCVGCGYDLRGSSVRCPECNSLIQPDRTKGIDL